MNQDLGPISQIPGDTWMEGRLLRIQRPFFTVSSNMIREKQSNSSDNADVPRLPQEQWAGGGL